MRKTSLLLLAMAACALPEPAPEALERGPGLLATCTDGERTVVFTAPAPHFTLRDGESIHPQLRPSFRAEWTGVLAVLQAGRYTIAGEAEIEIDGAPASGAIDLAAGPHGIRVRFDRASGDARLQLTWESEHFRREPIPAKAFSRPARPANVGIARTRRLDEGRRLVEDLNCMACHAGAPPSLRGRPGPDLAHVGTRVKADWLARWLADPRAWRPTATMPALLDDAERGHVSAWLATLRDPKDRAVEGPTDKFRATLGRELMQTVGCNACHSGADALRSLGSKYDAARLAQFLRAPLAVDPSGRMPDMMLGAEEAQLIAEALASETVPDAAPPGDAAAGRTIAVSRGCLNCHAVAGEASTLAAPRWERLRAGRGCLSGRPSVRYALTPPQRDAIGALLASPDAAASPVHAFRRTVETFRCTACHELDGALPQGLAELPPPLSDAGNKLRASWIEAVLAKKKRVRPWMGLRMPHFGEGNVAHLPAAFAAAAGAAHGEGALIVAPPVERVREGIRLVGKGDGALSCIGCHDFKGHPSTGTRGPDMTEMAARMRPEWFERWMREPGRLQPGTSMPYYWSGKSEPETKATIDALWALLCAGREMPLPEGMGAADTILLVKDEPVTVRCMMPGSSSRSIAVGFPGYLSICFDAEACRLRYAWKGDFLDMAGVWAGRGGTPARLLGEKIWTAPDAFPFGSRPKFRGYRLGSDRVPVFEYEVDGVAVSERIAPSHQGLVREFETAEELRFEGKPVPRKFSVTVKLEGR